MDEPLIRLLLVSRHISRARPGPADSLTETRTCSNTLSRTLLNMVQACSWYTYFPMTWKGFHFIPFRHAFPASVPLPLLLLRTDVLETLFPFAPCLFAFQLYTYPPARCRAVPPPPPPTPLQKLRLRMTSSEIMMTIEMNIHSRFFLHAFRCLSTNQFQHPSESLYLTNWPRTYIFSASGNTERYLTIYSTSFGARPAQIGAPLLSAGHV